MVLATAPTVGAVTFHKLQWPCSEFPPALERDLKLLEGDQDQPQLHLDSSVEREPCHASVPWIPLGQIDELGAEQLVAPLALPVQPELYQELIRLYRTSRNQQIKAAAIVMLPVEARRSISANARRARSLQRNCTTRILSVLQRAALRIDTLLCRHAGEGRGGDAGSQHLDSQAEIVQHAVVY